MNLIDKLKTLFLPIKSQPNEYEYGYQIGIEKAIEIVEAHDPWISVDDELPDTNREVFIMDSTPDYVDVGYFSKRKKNWVVYNGVLGKVTHYMEIPKTTKP